MRTPAIVVLLATCSFIVGACSSSPNDSAAPTGQSSPPAASASASGAEPRPGYVPALIGTWDYEFDRTERRTILKDFKGLVDGADRIVARLAFVDEKHWWLGFLFDGELFLLHGVPEGDGGTYTIDGDRLATKGASGAALVTYEWRLKGSKLTLTAVEECGVSAGKKVGCTRDRTEMDPIMRLVTEGTFTRSGSDVTY